MGKKSSNCYKENKTCSLILLKNWINAMELNLIINSFSDVYGNCIKIKTKIEKLLALKYKWMFNVMWNFNE